MTQTWVIFLQLLDLTCDPSRHTSMLHIMTSTTKQTQHRTCVIQVDNVAFAAAIQANFETMSLWPVLIELSRSKSSRLFMLPLELIDKIQSELLSVTYSDCIPHFEKISNCASGGCTPMRGGRDLTIRDYRNKGELSTGHTHLQHAQNVNIDNEMSTPRPILASTPTRIAWINAGQVSRVQILCTIPGEARLGQGCQDHKWNGE